MVFAGEGVELAAPQSATASGTSQPVVDVPPAGRVERPIALPVQPALPAGAERNAKSEIPSSTYLTSNQVLVGIEYLDHLTNNRLLTLLFIRPQVGEDGLAMQNNFLDQMESRCSLSLKSLHVDFQISDLL